MRYIAFVVGLSVFVYLYSLFSLLPSAIFFSAFELFYKSAGKDYKAILLNNPSMLSIVMIELQNIIVWGIQAAIVGYVTKTLLITYPDAYKWLYYITGVFFAVPYGYGKGPQPESVGENFLELITICAVIIIYIAVCFYV